MNQGLRTILRWTAVWLPLFLLACLLDRAAYRLFFWEDGADEDWVELLRQIGYMPTWLIVGLLLVLLDRRAGRGTAVRADQLVAPAPARPWHHRAGLVVLSAIVAGLIANILKPAIGRLRPDPELGGAALFSADRPMILWADGGNLGIGLPSGHTAVAFGGCAMLALLIPAWRWPMLALATGCGLTRLFAGAHTLSDVVGGAWVGIAVAAWLWAAGEGPRRGPAHGLLPADA